MLRIRSALSYAASLLRSPIFEKERYSQWLDTAPVPSNPLSWDDLLKIQNSSLTLRHVSSHEAAEREKTQGFVGDAISLSVGIYALIARESEKGNLSFKLPFSSNFSVFDMKENLRRITWTLQDQEIILNAYKEAIWQFVLTSLCKFDHQVDPESFSDGWLAKKQVSIQSTTAFIVLILPHHVPYDFGSYPLGKVGKQDFLPDSWKATIVSSTTLSSLPEGDFTSQVISLFNTCATDFFTQILNSIISQAESTSDKQ